jgi:hypothetical protein
MATIHTPCTGVPVLVYTPSPIGVPKVTLINEGTTNVFIGQAGVTQSNGLPLAPRQELSLAFAPFALYAVSGAAVSAVTPTTTTSAYPSGTTSVAVTSAVGTANGQQIQVGTGSNAEMVTILSGGGTGPLVLVSGLKYDHASGAAVTVMTPAGSAVRAETGI